jgi:hypothetical protein
MSTNSTSSYCTLQISGQSIPYGTTIQSMVIRTDTKYAIPMLDFILIDSNNCMANANIMMTKGSDVLANIFADPAAITTTAMLYTISNIVTQRVGSNMVIYKVMCYFKSNMILHGQVFNFVGPTTQAIKQIVTNDIQGSSITFNTNVLSADDVTAQYLKIQTDSYAKFLRKTLLPSLQLTDSTSYFLYYHDGLTVEVYDVNALMANYNQIADPNQVNSAGFSLSSKNIVRQQIMLGDVNKSLENNSYGATIYQYNIDTGQYSSSNKSNYVANGLLSTNLSYQNLQDNQVIVAGTDVGNHVPNYYGSYLNNKRVEGLYDVQIAVQILSPSNLTGLSIVPYFSSPTVSIPFVLLGKSIIFRNNQYEENLFLGTNSNNTAYLVSQLSSVIPS